MSSDISACSLAAVRPHVPSEWVAPIEKILRATPAVVRIAKRRKSKHGDHRLSPNKRHSIISVNESGNPWQFVLTLLHELAHAQVAHQFGPRAAPHGGEWKTAFRELLVGHLDLFPAELSGAVSAYARKPLYSTSAHPLLAAALGRYDTTDTRPTVEELSAGQMFSLDGKLMMIKRHRLRTRFLCTTIDGRKYHVSSAARVHSLHDRQ